MGVEGGLSFRIFGIVGSSIDGTEDLLRLGDGRGIFWSMWLGFGELRPTSYTGDTDR